MKITLEFKLAEADEKILREVLRKDGDGDEMAGAVAILQKHAAQVKLQELQKKLRDDAMDLSKRFGVKE